MATAAEAVRAVGVALVALDEVRRFAEDARTDEPGGADLAALAEYARGWVSRVGQDVADLAAAEGREFHVVGVGSDRES